MRARITLPIGAFVLMALPAVLAAQGRPISRDPLPSMGIPQWPGPPRSVPIAESGMPKPTPTLPTMRVPPATPRVPPSQPVYMRAYPYPDQYLGRTYPYGYNRPFYGQQFYGQQFYGQQLYSQQLYGQLYGQQFYGFPYGLPYALPFYDPGYYTQVVDAAQYALPPPPEPPPPAQGSVALVVEPGSAQVLVDGDYVGTADDFDGTQRTLMLAQGVHNVDLSEYGYEAIRFQVQADESQPTVYRRRLTRVEPQSPPPARGTSDWKPSPMWAVPGCYLGNIPPKDAGLPATCDATKGVRIR